MSDIAKFRVTGPNNDTLLTGISIFDYLVVPGPKGDKGDKGDSGAGSAPLVGHAALRAIDSAALVVQEELRIVVRQVSSFWTGSGWFLIAGTDTDDDDTVIRPHDYAATTNEKIWVKVFGL